MSRNTLAKSLPAYFDGFNGLIPCVVTAITGTSGAPSTEQRVTLQVRRNGRGYRAGELIECFALHAIPHGAILRRKYSTSIGAYSVIAE